MMVPSCIPIYHTPLYTPCTQSKSRRALGAGYEASVGGKSSVGHKSSVISDDSSDDAKPHSGNPTTPPVAQIV